MTPLSAETRSLLPLASTVLLGSVGLLLTYLKDLGKQSKRIRYLDEATKRLVLCETAIRALKQAGRVTDVDVLELNNELRRSLRLARLQLRNHTHINLWTLAEVEAYKAELPAWRRFTLFYKQPSPRARVFLRSGLLLASFLIARAGLNVFPSTTSPIVSFSLYEAVVVAVGIVVLTRMLGHYLDFFYIEELTRVEKALDFMRVVDKKNERQR